MGRGLDEGSSVTGGRGLDVGRSVVGGRGLDVGRSVVGGMESAQRGGMDGVVDPRTIVAPRVVGSDRQLVSKKVSSKVVNFSCPITFFITGFAKVSAISHIVSIVAFLDVCGDSKLYHGGSSGSPRKRENPLASQCETGSR